MKTLTNNIDGDTSIVFDYANYDKVGNRLSCKVDDTEAHVYTYDNLYQLTNVDYNDGNSTNYYYDELGSRTKITNGGTVNYASNNLNQYTAVGGANYDYDDNGNLWQIDFGEYRYYYDCENRLIEAKENYGQPVASYKYDFAGRRVKKVHYPLGDTEYYVYDGGQVIAEYEDDVLVRKFIYGPGIDEPICMIEVDGETETKYYYHFDGLGSVIALSDGVGNVVERCSYDVFGEPNRTSSVGNPYMFTGRRYDSETALYYYRARYYKPAIGRFLQTDPIPALNLYTYCGNNPINWIDPWGLDKVKEDGDHNLEQTEALLKKLRNPFYYLRHGGPIGHAIPPWLGGFDYQTEFGKFTILENGKEVILFDSEFGNFYAAYAGYYYGGWLGLGAVVMAGDYFAGVAKTGAYWRLHSRADDPDSQRDHARGYRAASTYKSARARKCREILPQTLNEFWSQGP